MRGFRDLCKVESRARSIDEVSVSGWRLVSPSAYSGLANDRGAGAAWPRFVGMFWSLRATLTNDLPVFASCRKRSGSLIGGTIVGLDRVLRPFRLDNITREIELHEKAEEMVWYWCRMADSRSRDQRETTECWLATVERLPIGWRS